MLVISYSVLTYFFVCHVCQSTEVVSTGLALMLTCPLSKRGATGVLWATS